MQGAGKWDKGDVQRDGGLDDAKVVEKGFRERKVDSLKVITCHKLPGQQA